jgi:hypothetical protein
MLMPIALTDSELDIVMRAAQPLAVNDRDPFLRDVAERLAALPHLGDGLVFQICREVQREHWDPPDEMRAAIAIKGAANKRLTYRQPRSQEPPF